MAATGGTGKVSFTSSFYLIGVCTLTGSAATEIGAVGAVTNSTVVAAASATTMASLLLASTDA